VIVIEYAMVNVSELNQKDTVITNICIGNAAFEGP